MSALLRAACLSSGKEISFQQKIKEGTPAENHGGRLEAVTFEER